MRNLSRTNVFWLVALLGLLLLVMYVWDTSSSGKELEYSKFRDLVAQEQVKEVKVKGQTITGKLKDAEEFTSTGPIEQAQVVSLLDEYQVPYQFEVEADDSIWLTGLFTLLPLAVLVILFVCWLLSRILNSVTRGYYVWPIRLGTATLMLLAMGVTAGITVSILHAV